VIAYLFVATMYEMKSYQELFPPFLVCVGVFFLCFFLCCCCCCLLLLLLLLLSPMAEAADNALPTPASDDAAASPAPLTRTSTLVSFEDVSGGEAEELTKTRTPKFEQVIDPTTLGRTQSHRSRRLKDRKQQGKVRVWNKDNIEGDDIDDDDDQVKPKRRPRQAAKRKRTKGSEDDGDESAAASVDGDGAADPKPKRQRRTTTTTPKTRTARAPKAPKAPRAHRGPKHGVANPDIVVG
jgi:hypothetical protein